MTESATLQVNVVEKGVKQVSVNLDAVSRAAANAEKSTDKFSKQLSKTEIEAKKTGSALDALKNIAASYITIKTLQGAIKMADTMTVLRSQVNLVTKSQEESIAVQQQLFDISNRTYASLEATTTLYTRTARALQHLNKSSAETLKFTEAINNAMRLGGVSANEQASALLQLSQAMGSGVLQGDEFRSLAENAPILLDILSKHMGVMRGELKQMGSEGKITSEIIFEAMTKASDELSKKAASMPVTFGQSMQVMNTHVMSFVDSMMNGSGIMTAVAAMVITLAENIEYILVPAMGVAGVFAVKALTTAFMMLGGPMGIIAVVVGALGLLAAGFTKSKMESDKLRDSVIASAESIDNMTEAQLILKQEDIAQVYRDQAEAISEQQKRVDELTDSLAQMERMRAKYEKNGDIKSFDYLYGEKFSRVKKDLETQNALLDVMISKLSQVFKVGKKVEDNLLKRKAGYAHYNQGQFVGAPSPFTKEEMEGKAEYLKVMGKIRQQADLIGKSGAEAKFIQMQQNGELEKMTEIQKKVIKFFLQMNDAAAKVADNQQSLNSMMESLGREAATVGMNRRQVALFDAKALGATPEQEKEINAYFDRISKGGGKGFGGSNPFTDRLKSLSEEAAKLQAINAEIQKYGEAGRYTAVQEITLELNNQNGVLKGISATQKQMLLDQAALLDNQRQMNEVLTLGSNYGQRLDDMTFELELIGKTSDEIEDLRFIRELEVRARAIANGASKETIDLLEKEIAKIKERKDAYNAKREKANDSPLGGISDGFEKYVNSMGTVREQFATATESMFGGLTDAVASFASGADKSFSEMTRSVLQNISKMLIQMAILNAMKMAFGDVFSNLGMANGGAAYANGGMVGFAEGGFTGFGSKYEPAGIVHRGEVVWSQADVAKHGGISQVEKMRKKYANGGAVGVDQYQQNSSNSDGIVINITQYEDGSHDVDVTRDGKAFEKFVKVTVEKEVANQMRSGGSLARR